MAITACRGRRTLIGLLRRSKDFRQAPRPTRPEPWDRPQRASFEVLQKADAAIVVITPTLRHLAPAVMDRQATVQLRRGVPRLLSCQLRSTRFEQTGHALFA